MADAPPTRDRIVDSAIKLFAERGVDAVGIRDITAACGIRESSLYNHFNGRDALLKAVFERLSSRLVEAGLADAKCFAAAHTADMNLAGILMEGGRLFFSRADNEMLRIWRILMEAQYRYPKARDCLREAIMEAPRLFFAELISSLGAAGRLRPGVDISAAADCVAALYFEFSFRSNLDMAWGQPRVENAERLVAALSMLAAAIG